MKSQPVDLYDHNVTLFPVEIEPLTKKESEFTPEEHCNMSTIIAVVFWMTLASLLFI